MYLNKAIELIKSKKVSTERPFIIAISGFGGSGKTTLAKKIKESLGGCEIVSIDSFITGTQWERSEDWSNFDKDRFKSKILEKVIANVFPIIYEDIHWPGTKSEKKFVLNKSKYLIVEGCSIFHPSLLSFYDFKIWVNRSLVNATDKGIIRDKGDEDEIMKNLWLNIFKPNEEDFLIKSVFIE